MGVVYKLKPEVSNFILETKKARPELGCRSLALLAQDYFKIAISKSSVNTLIKNSGLSMPVGRRRKLRQGSIECLGLGAILLKSADYLLGGCLDMANLIQERKKISQEDARSRLEFLIYSPLLPAQAQGCVSRYLVSQKITLLETQQFLEELDKDSTLTEDLLQRIAGLTTPVRYLRIDLSDGSTYYLDGQLHTVWSTPQVPRGFATTLHNAKRNLEAIFRGEYVLTLFLAPGYEAPTGAFISFLRSAMGEVAITKVAFCADDARELEIMVPPDKRGFSFICAVWPWQFMGSGTLKTASEFRRYIFLPLKKEFSIAAAEIGFLRQPEEGGFTLKGVALKPGPQDPISMVILGNFAQQQFNIDSVANEFFGHWADPKAVLQDYSKKIEDFAKEMDSGWYSPVVQVQEKPLEPGIKGVITLYRALLDANVRLYFLPQLYANETVKAIQERFYSLKAVLTRKKEYSLITFIPSPGYGFHDALQYACQKVNQAFIFPPDLKRLYLIA